MEGDQKLQNPDIAKVYEFDQLHDMFTASKIVGTVWWDTVLM
jgi:hypothetical protein